ncbi:MAG: hypothetical protein R3A47_00875 [Polyangiales bacterium]
MLVELRSNIVGVDTDSGAPPVEAQLISTMKRIMRTIVNNRLLTTMIVREAVGLDEEVDLRLREFYDSILQYVRDSIVRGQAMGILRAQDSDVAAMCVLGTIKQIMDYLVMNDPDDVDVDRIASGVLDYNLRGLIK